MPGGAIFWGVVGCIVVTVAIGLFAARNVKGSSVNYIVAGRGLIFPLVAATLMAQSVDSNATVGNTDLVASSGFWAGASLPVGLSLCLFLTGLFLAKPMNQMNLITLPDFYRQRYNRIVEIIAALLMFLSFCLLLAGNLVAGGYMVETFLGVSYNWGIVLITIVVLSYTVSGGMFAAAYTDVIQVSLGLIGSISLFVYVIVTFGITIPEGQGPLAFAQLTEPAAGALTNWATILALGLGDIVAIDFMQRIFSADSPETAQRACFTGSFGTLLVGIPFSMVALSTPSILQQQGVNANGPILYALLQNVAPVAIAILVLAGIIGASLSTGDGAIMGTASVLTRNVFGIRVKDKGKEGEDENDNDGDKLLWTTRAMTVVMALVGVFFALRVPETGILLLLAFDLLFAGLMIPLVGGLYWAKSTWQGALACILIGSTVRIVQFALVPTTYGIENTLLYFPNNIFTKGFDGIPTLVSPLIGLVAFVVVSRMTAKSKRSRQRG